MSNETLQLKREVFKTDSPSRDLVVRYFKAIAAEAKRLPVSERDDLAAEILQPFAELSNPPEEYPDLEYIAFQLAGGNLDVLSEESIKKGTADSQVGDRRLKEVVWRELIQCIEQLHL